LELKSLGIEFDTTNISKNLSNANRHGTLFNERFVKLDNVVKNIKVGGSQSGGNIYEDLYTERNIIGKIINNTYIEEKDNDTDKLTKEYKQQELIMCLQEIYLEYEIMNKKEEKSFFVNRLSAIKIDFDSIISFLNNNNNIKTKDDIVKEINTFFNNNITLPILVYVGNKLKITSITMNVNDNKYIIALYTFIQNCKYYNKNTNYTYLNLIEYAKKNNVNVNVDDELIKLYFNFIKDISNISKLGDDIKMALFTKLSTSKSGGNSRINKRTIKNGNKKINKKINKKKSKKYVNKKQKNNNKMKLKNYTRKHK
jgi:hypothetical protein